MATTEDQEIQAQLTKLTKAVQIVHDFGQDNEISIENPEGGVIRTLYGINKAIDDALPGYADAGAAAAVAKDARDAAQTAQVKAEAAATSASNAVASAIYKVKAYSGADSISVLPMDATIHTVVLDRPLTAILVGSTADEAGMARQISIWLNQSTGSNKVKWPDNVKWSNDRAPILSFESGYTDIITLITINAGSTWLGFFNSGWINA